MVPAGVGELCEQLGAVGLLKEGVQRDDVRVVQTRSLCAGGAGHDARVQAHTHGRLHIDELVVSACHPSWLIGFWSCRRQRAYGMQAGARAWWAVQCSDPPWDERCQARRLQAGPPHRSNDGGERCGSPARHSRLPPEKCSSGLIGAAPDAAQTATSCAAYLHCVWLPTGGVCGNGLQREGQLGQLHTPSPACMGHRLSTWQQGAQARQARSQS